MVVENSVGKWRVQGPKYREEKDLRRFEPLGSSCLQAIDPEAFNRINQQPPELLLIGYDAIGCAGSDFHSSFR
jgi:hypothetical protein